MYKLLAIEPDLNMCEILDASLSSNYAISFAHDAKTALKLTKSQTFDLFLLEMTLPDICGVRFCEILRTYLTAPVIFTSALNETPFILDALAAGGDDYLTKPFDPQELNARIQANLRRVELEKKQTSNTPATFHFASVNIDFKNHIVFKDDQEIYLSPIEFEIMFYLALNRNRIVHSNEIYQYIWKKDSFGDTRTVMVHISNLRKKLEDIPTKPKYIQTVRKLGYILNIPE